MDMFNAATILSFTIIDIAGYEVFIRFNARISLRCAAGAARSFSRSSPRHCACALLSKNGPEPPPSSGYAAIRSPPMKRGFPADDFVYTALRHFFQLRHCQASPSRCHERLEDAAFTPPAV